MLFELLAPGGQEQAAWIRLAYVSQDNTVDRATPVAPTDSVPGPGNGGAARNPHPGSQIRDRRWLFSRRGRHNQAAGVAVAAGYGCQHGGSELEALLPPFEDRVDAWHGRERPPAGVWRRVVCRHTQTRRRQTMLRLAAPALIGKSVRDTLAAWASI